MILVDTSVWIAVFRRDDPLDLDAVLPFDEVVTCPPVVQEVLQGFRHDRAFRVARDALLNLPCVDAPLPRDRFLEAAELYRMGRRVGLTIRSSTDCLIAATALKHGLTVAHRDRDYALLGGVADLRHRQV